MHKVQHSNRPWFHYKNALNQSICGFDSGYMEKWQTVNLMHLKHLIDSSHFSSGSM